MDPVERARRYVARMPLAVSGSGGSTACLQVASALRHGFALSLREAWPLLVAYSSRCTPPWSERELRHKLEAVEKRVQPRPRGYLLREQPPQPPEQTSGQSGTRTQAPEQPPGPSGTRAQPPPGRNWRAFDPAALQREQRTDLHIDAAWLRRRSPVDPCGITAGEFLRQVTLPGDRLLVFDNERSQGQFLFWHHPHRGGWYQLGAQRGQPAAFVCGPEVTPAALRSARQGVWWLCQPVTGRWRENGENWSRRSGGNVTAWRMMVIESDEEGIEAQWLNLLVQLPLRLVALYSSGGRSIHALVRVDMADKAAWDSLRDRLKPVLTRLGADPGVFSAVRLTRLPGCLREGRQSPDGRSERYAAPREQRLLFLHPRADWRPVLHLPVLRTVPDSPRHD